MEKRYKLYCKQIKDRTGKIGWCYIKIYRDNIVNVFISNENPLQFISKRDNFLDDTEVLVCDFYNYCFGVLLV